MSNEKCFCHVKDRVTGEMLAVKDAAARADIALHANRLTALESGSGGSGASGSGATWTSHTTPKTLAEIVETMPTEIITAINADYCGYDFYYVPSAHLVRTNNDASIAVYEGEASMFYNGDSGNMMHRIGHLKLEIGDTSEIYAIVRLTNYVDAYDGYGNFDGDASLNFTPGVYDLIIDSTDADYSVVLKVYASKGE